ncbi:MAG: amidophosphoribosyltransferase [Deltaproteobacteria bacterium]|jgi:amidophosphoribosyltransferase|nr:MAG: amidophosphoribosyltransferase [Deltaproteobacteria bacterium]
MKSIGDNCGVFGIAKETDCVQDIYRGLDFLQHRGQQFCGIATYDGKRIYLITHYGQVGNTFNPHELETFKGNIGIGHVSLKERQPMMWQGAVGEIAVAFSGNIINSEALLEEMKDRGEAFYHGLDIEIISKLIMQEKNVVTGISMLAEKIKGSYSLVVLTQDGIYASRDIYGFRPLMLGEGSGTYLVSSESRAVQNLGFNRLRDVRPGEIVFISKKGFETRQQLKSPRRAHCAFEWAYTASMDSKIDGLYVQEARNNLGKSLAERDNEEGGIQADLVAPVPMSGIGHALGYHMVSRLPYQEVFLYNRYADRSYTQLTQEDRDRMAKKKLSVLEYAVRDKKIVLCDDSIVRGTQIRNKVRDLKNAGAKEVHVRIACPPLMYPCDLGISTRTYGELLAREYLSDGNITTMDELKALEVWVSEKIGADSVCYNSLEAFVEALKIPKEDLCIKCWDGNLPTAL